MSQRPRASAPTVSDGVLNEDTLYIRRIEPCVTDLWMIASHPKDETPVITRVRAWGWSEAVADRTGYSEVFFGPLGIIDGAWVAASRLVDGDMVYDSENDASIGIAVLGS